MKIKMINYTIKFTCRIGLVIAILSIVSMACQRQASSYTAYYGPIEYDPATRPKQIIETSHLRTLIEKDYKVRVDYLDCFRFDTTEEGTVRFFSKDDDLPVRMVMFVEPNVEGWTIEEAVINLRDSCTEDIEVGKNYFIFGGNLGDSSLVYLEKCYLIDDKWIDYTMFYRRENEGAVNRMANIIINWCPIEESDTIASNRK